MPEAIPTYRPVHLGTRRARRREHDARRGSARSRGYNTRWEKSRKVYLAEHPLCVCCEVHGRVTPATVVDHVIPHQGDMVLFWDPDNRQGLCEDCHNGEKAHLEHLWAKGNIDASQLRFGAVV